MKALNGWCIFAHVQNRHSGFVANLVRLKKENYKGYSFLNVITPATIGSVLGVVGKSFTKGQ